MALISRLRIRVVTGRQSVSSRSKSSAHYSIMEETQMKTRYQARSVLGFGVRAGLLAFATAGVVQAASFPAQPVTLVVPFPPGGTTDIAARTVAQAMEKTLGQSVVVDN